ncbi:MAG: response regulator [Syntrophobacteraceae bacterium]
MKVRVLLVDDEREFIDTLGERLESRGLSVSKAESGNEALEKIQEENIDVVVLDVLMPGKDGVATLKEIKSIKPLLEVILLSGNATVEAAVEGLKQGAFDFLLKPTEVTDLMEKIALAFKRKADQENRIRNAEIQRILLTRSWS